MSDYHAYLLCLLFNTPRRGTSLIKTLCKLTISEEELAAISSYICKDIAKTGIYKEIRTKDLIGIPKYVLDTSKLSTKYRSVATLNGVPFDLAKSALQKYTRRGMLEQAQTIACEMDMFRFVPEAKGEVTNFYNRIRIITLEDIGLASPETLLMVNKYLPMWLADSGLSKNLLSIIKLLTVCPHTRFYSHINEYYRQNVPPAAKQTPKLVYNLGKDSSDKSLVDFVKNLIYCLENKDLAAFYWTRHILIKYEKLTEKRYNSTRTGFLIFDILKRFITPSSPQVLRDSFAVCVDWYKTLKAKEQFLCCVHPVCLYILHGTYKTYPLVATTDQTLEPYNGVLLNNSVFIDDYARDMHTQAGKRLGRTSADFALEGSLVAFNMDFDTRAMKVYVEQKIAGGKPGLESDEFTLKVRAQLICSASRQDTFFATNKLGENVVVKGPYLTMEEVITPFNIQTVLGLFRGVNNVNVNIKILIPDIFQGDQATPLGTRTKIEPGKPYYYVVMQDLMNQEKYPAVLKSSKVWPDTKVVDYDKLFSTHPEFGFGVPSEMTNLALVSFLLQITARYVFKIGDFAARNFIRIGDRVWNLDTENVDVNNVIRYKRSEIDILVRALHDNMDEYTRTVNEWLDNTIAWNLTTMVFGEKFSQSVQERLRVVLSNPNSMFSKSE